MRITAQYNVLDENNCPICKCSKYSSTLTCQTLFESKLLKLLENRFFNSSKNLDNVFITNRAVSQTSETHIT